MSVRVRGDACPCVRVSARACQMISQVHPKGQQAPEMRTSFSLQPSVPYPLGSMA